MPPLYRIFEVALYAVLNFFPFMILALYPFQNKLRYSRPVTSLLVAAVTLVQIAFGLYSTLFPAADSRLSAVSTAVYLLFFFIAVKARFTKVLFVLLLLSNIANFCVTAAKCLEGIFFPALAVQAYRWSFSAFLVLVEAITLVPLFFYIRKTFSQVLNKEIGNATWRFLWLIPATFYVIWFYQLYMSKETALEIALEPAHSVFMLAVNLGAVWIYHLVVKLITVIEKNIALEKQNFEFTMQKLQYDNLQERIAEARQAKHDVRQHIHVMSALLEDKKYEELSSYLNQYKLSVPDDRSIVFCNHYATNTLLLYFAQLAKQNQISFAAKVDIDENIGIPDNVLSVLLGNLLENAIEGCMTVNDRKREIAVKSICEGGTVLFKIRNTYSGSLKRDKNGLYLSNKHPGRGIGLSSVRNLTAQYDGMLEIQQEDGNFIVTVMLMIP